LSAANREVVPWRTSSCARCSGGPVRIGSSGGSLKAEFAEHLGISEARVPKYIKDHCVVRWQQLDEGAGPLAHFAIAVLRPALNE